MYSGNYIFSPYLERKKFAKWKKNSKLVVTKDAVIFRGMAIFWATMDRIFPFRQRSFSRYWK